MNPIVGAYILATAVISTFAVSALPRIAHAVPVTECTGCKGSAFNDPTQNIIDGFQVISAAAGLTFTGSLIIREHGSCLLVQTPGGWVCSADKNCKFGTTYTARDDGTNGQFRNDRLPWCEWSMQSSPGDDSIMTSLQSNYPDWIAACNSNTFQSVRFYKDAADCQTGTLIGEIKYHAVCAACPP